MDLPPVPPATELAATRRSLHLLAAHVIAEERYRRVGHSGLEPTPHGMRTPAGEPDGVELDLDHLVVRRDGRTERRPVTTVGEAQSWVLGDVGPPRWGAQVGLHDPPELVPPDTRLRIDPEVARWLGGWLAVGSQALGELVTDPASEEANVPTLWPEHFDVGIELLPGDRRASYGISPGDAGIEGPYAYVAAWYADRLGGLDDPRWNASAFSGAVVMAEDLEPSVDAQAQLLAWFRERRDLLASAAA